MVAYPKLAARGFLLPTRLRNSSSYDAAGMGRRSSSWKATSGGPATTPLSALSQLRNRSRSATRNDPYGFSVIDRLTSNTIGTGITPKPMHKDASIRVALQELWEDWSGEADADGRTDFYGLQALICRTVYESGECFVRLRPRRPSDGLTVPLQLQVLEPDFVPHDKHELYGKGRMTRAGIQFNGIGQRIAYWMYRCHPGDGLTAGYNDLMEVPAAQVLHIYEPLRPGQLRGVPVLAPILARLKSLDEFDDATLFRQEVANLFAGFIREPVPEIQAVDSSTGQVTDEFDADFTPMIGLEPGTMQKLRPGEEVEFSEPPDAGNTYQDFMRQQLLAIAAGTGLPFEILTGDLRNVNDRVIRVVLNEFRRRIEQRQWGVFIHQLCRPVRAAWLDAAALSGAIALPDYENQRRAYLRTRWVPQGWRYLHPVQDIQSQILAIKAGISSRSEAILERGYDAEVIDAEIAADKERAEELGLSFETDPGEIERDEQDDEQEKQQ